MTTKIINTCTAPDGTVFKRTSSSGRKYSHAVIGKASNGKFVDLCWNSRLDLAQKSLGQWPGYEKIIVIVQSVEKEVKQGKRYEKLPVNTEIDGLAFALQPNEHGLTKHEAQYNGWTIKLYWEDTGFAAHARRNEKILLPTVHTKYDGTTYQNEDYHRCYISPKGRGSAAGQVQKIKKLIDEKEAGR